MAQRSCEQCGADLPVNAPQGLCPRCLLGAEIAATDVVPEMAEVEKHRLEAGTTIGRYKVVEKLAEGGFGVVYIAESEALNRRVALKIIKPGMDTEQVVARFEAERQVLALMEHPNIAKVFDAGTTETGRPYFVMELVPGVRLTDYCDQTNLPTTQRLELFIRVCEAIQHAHQKGIIHRDIKPSNILVTASDGEPIPKVIDFGIAKATQGSLSGYTAHTQLNQFIGTPAYMSPEQAGLDGLDIDTRTDIYSLGVVLYELLTGTTPFDTKELLKAGFDGMRQIIRQRQPLRPSTRLTRELAAKAGRPRIKNRKSKIGDDLDWIVMKALEKDRARRYATANGLAMDLRRHLADEPVTAGPPSAVYKFRKFARRNRVALAVAASMVAVLLMATGISVRQAVRATKAEKLAQKRLGEAEGVSRFLTEVFQSPDPKRDGRTITVAERLDVAVTNLERDLAAQPERRTSLQAALGATYHALGLNKEGIALQQKVLDYYRATNGLEDPDTIEAMTLLAQSYSHAGRRAEALQMQEQALALSRKVNGPQHTNTLVAMNNLAKSYSLGGRWGEAIKLQEEVVKLTRELLGPEDPHTLLAMNNLGAAYWRSGQTQAALQVQEEVFALYRKVNGPEDPDTLRAMNNLANTCFEAGQRDRALDLGEEVVRLMRKVNGPEHPFTVAAMNNLARTYDGVDRREEALKLRQEVLELMSKVNGPEHPDTLRAMGNLAQSYYFAGHKAQALKLQTESLELMRKVNGPEHPDTLDAMHLVAFYTYDTGQAEEGVKLFEEVLALRRKVVGPEHPTTLKAMAGLLVAYRAAGRTEAAIELAQTNLDLHRRVLGPTNANTLSAMTQLAMSYGAAHRIGDAIPLEEEALQLKRSQFPAGNSSILASLEDLANLYEQADRKEDAERLRQELVQLKAKSPDQKRAAR